MTLNLILGLTPQTMRGECISTAQGVQMLSTQEAPDLRDEHLMEIHKDDELERQE